MRPLSPQPRDKMMGSIKEEIIRYRVVGVFGKSLGKLRRHVWDKLWSALWCELTDHIAYYTRWRRRRP